MEINQEAIFLLLQKEKRVTEGEVVDGITNSMDMNPGKLWEMVKNRETWRAAVHGLQSWT